MCIIYDIQHVRQSISFFEQVLLSRLKFRTDDLSASRLASNLAEIKEKKLMRPKSIRHDNKVRACMLAEEPMSARLSIVIVAPGHAPDPVIIDSQKAARDVGLPGTSGRPGTAPPRSVRSQLCRVSKPPLSVRSSPSRTRFAVLSVPRVEPSCARGQKASAQGERSRLQETALPAPGPS